MKSIGNGWKRAQEAQQRKKDAERVRGYWAINEKTTIDCMMAAQNQASTLEHLSAQMGDGMRAMTPEAMKEKAEREAPLSQNVYPAHYAFSENLESTNWTTWQRIKRALRTL